MNRLRPSSSVLVLTIILVGIVGYRAYEDFIVDDIVLHVDAPCDPREASCFIVADPDQASFGFQAEPYKKIEVIDRYAPACLEEHTCASFSCAGVYGCTELACTDNTLDTGESCVTAPDETHS